MKSRVKLEEPIEFLNNLKYFDMPMEHRMWIAQNAKPAMVRDLKDVEGEQEVNADAPVWPIGYTLTLFDTFCSYGSTGS